MGGALALIYLACLLALPHNAAATIPWNQAAATVGPNPIVLPTQHKGDNPIMEGLGIKNSAPAGHSEKLDAFFSGYTANAVTNGGSISLLAAGSMDSASMMVGLSTASAGVFTEGVTVGLSSDGYGTSGHGTTALTSQTITVQGTVNNYANPVFTFLSGYGALTGGGTSYTLDLGRVERGETVSTTLAAKNDVAGPADLLDGHFTVNTGSPFDLTFNDFASLSAGGTSGPLSIGLTATNTGTFSDTVVFSPTGHNDSGFSETFSDITLKITGNVSAPVPPSLILLLSGLTGIVTVRLRARAGRKTARKE